jgi:hypothetical protein
MLMLVCRGCGNPAAHTLKRVGKWFTIFFIPAFPIARTRYYTQCTFCGITIELDKQQADQLCAQDQQMRQQPQNSPYPVQPQ